MNEAQIRNMTPDELLSAWECGQVSDTDMANRAAWFIEEMRKEADDAMAGCAKMEEQLEELKEQTKDRDALYRTLRTVQAVMEGVEL